MTERDSFIDEVSDELKRDRLFAQMRRYAPFAILAVLGIVGAAAYFEYDKNSARREAELRGNALYAALEAEAAEREALLDPAGLGLAAPVASLLASSARIEATPSEQAAAAEPLVALASSGAEPLYADIAALKRVSLDETLSPEVRIGILDPLTAPGRPYRPLALEYRALAYVDMDDRDAAIADLQEARGAAEAPKGVIERAGQLLKALGVSLEEG